MRNLIVNADDFGVTAGINRAVSEASSKGILRSATLIASANAFKDAVAIAKALGPRRLSVGCHGLVVDGAPVLTADKIETLLDPEDHSRLRTRLRDIILSTLAKRIREDELELEFIAQIKRLQNEGIAVSHVDTHKHTHWLPGVFVPLMRAAKACGVNAIRNPFCPPPLRMSLRFHSGKPWRRTLKVALLARFAAEFDLAVKKHDLVSTDGSFGVFDNGLSDLEKFRAIVECIPPGTWELVSHPGYCDDDLRRIKTSLQASREAELALLISPEARDILDKNSVVLTSYSELSSSVSKALAVDCHEPTVNLAHQST